MFISEVHETYFAWIFQINLTVGWGPGVGSQNSSGTWGPGVGNRVGLSEIRESSNQPYSQNINVMYCVFNLYKVMSLKAVISLVYSKLRIRDRN